MPDDSGKINGTVPCFNDVLAFFYCKMKVCPRDTLLGVVKGFYKYEDLVKARDVLFTVIPEGDSRRIKHRKVEEILGSIYVTLQQLSSEDPPAFIAIDLNNIPCVEMRNIDGVSVVCQQTRLNRQMDEVLREQAVMRAQLAELLKATQMQSGASTVCMSDNHGNLPASAPVATYASAASGPPSGQQRRPQPPRNDAETAPRPQDVRRRDGRTDDRVRQPSTGSDRRPQRQPSADGERGQHGATGRYVSDDEGFQSRAPRQRRPVRNVLTGKKSGSALKASSVVKQARIFVSRVDPSVSIDSIKEFVRELTGTECNIDKVKTKYPTYASYVITCDCRHEQLLMNPDEWEEGILIRKFYGKLTHNTDDDTT